MSKSSVKSSRLHSFVRKGLDHSPSFDPRRDVEGSQDWSLLSMYRYAQDWCCSVIPSGDMSNNGIEDPANVIGLVRDEFAAIDAQRAIRKYGKKAAQAAKEATQVGAPAPFLVLQPPDPGKSE